MDTQTRDLHYQIMTAITQVEGTPLTRDETFVTQVTEVLPGVKGMQAIQGTSVTPGLTTVPTQSGVYLTRTFHRRGDQEIAIYNICVMDAAGAIRLVRDMRMDTRTPGFANKLRTPLAKLVDEHDQLNGKVRPRGFQLAYSINQAAKQIMDLLPEEKARLVLFGLEMLDDKEAPHDYEAFCEAVMVGIEARLTTGLW